MLMMAALHLRLGVVAVGKTQRCICPRRTTTPTPCPTRTSASVASTASRGAGCGSSWPRWSQFSLSCLNARALAPFGKREIDCALGCQIIEFMTEQGEDCLLYTSPSPRD